MAPELRPVATGFFPATRMGLAVGVVVAFVGATLWMRDGKTEVVSSPVQSAAVAPEAVGAERAPFVGLPLMGPVVAHVWLENCADCMPAFEAHKHMKDIGALDGLPQVNVAYGASTPTFARTYRVNDNLLVDVDGSQVVHRFGISSFTTLVLDTSGAVIHRDRPDQDGYAQRVREAWTRAVR